ncbi:MAG: extracellular solute-binding protein [Pirellulales bacterium]|nr:extracellular solute-binding protein [Pirellulales bacterium]
MRRHHTCYTAYVLACLMLVLQGCGVQEEAQLVAYVAHDSEFSQPILDDFEQETGIEIQKKFDTESTKTVGLANAIIGEANRPRCDVFWNNEILNTLRLQRQGLLAAYVSPQSENYPEMFQSPDGLWYGFAARARILIVNTDLVPASERPTSIRDLARPEFQGRCGIAKPLFGTTATHAACLFAAWGDVEAKAFFRSLRDNDVKVMAGNKQVAMAVAEGELAFGLTDTDDAMVAISRGYPVEIVYPDREPDQLGTLFIPNTLAIMKDCPHPEAARTLVDYLLQADVEAKLAASASAQIPLNRGNAEIEVQVETPRTVHAMDVDFNAAAERWDEVAGFIRETFGT